MATAREKMLELSNLTNVPAREHFESLLLTTSPIDNNLIVDGIVVKLDSIVTSTP